MNNGLSAASSALERFERSSALEGNDPSVAGRDSGNQESRRNLPAVEKVLHSLGQTDLPRVTLVALIRRELAILRQSGAPVEPPQVLARIQAACDRCRHSRLQMVINGTGILLHTNLGRAPLSSGVVEHLTHVASHYNTLEYDLESGGRGSRAPYLEFSLALLCRAEAATVVNNCAAALVLVLRRLTRKKPEVVISRGELIQIGGGFRIPEILEASGAVLQEIGTTNKTSLQDYANALSRRTGLILKVHRSNFFMDGFVECPGTEAIVALARAKRVPVVEDLGSGAMIRTEDMPGLEHEPTPREVLKQGVSLVTFSGDKLFGGPQAGLIAGKSQLISALKREPLFRALRCDKLVLAALEKTVELYLDGQPERGIPILKMMQVPEQELQQRGQRLIRKLNALPVTIELGMSNAQVGGGTLPRSALPSVTLDVKPRNCDVTEFAKRLREGPQPVIAQVSQGSCRIHLRTVLPHQDPELAAAIQAAALDSNTPRINEH